MSQQPALRDFVTLVVAEGGLRYRDLPWRRTRDPYQILVSEVMLQQTQVARVLVRFPEWLAEFPTLDALAAAPLEAVLRAWQGLGYNRRAVALKRAADRVAETHGGQLPADEAALRALPGVGAATAAGLLAFAFDLPTVYLETNVRAVFLHELFAEADAVPDCEIRSLVSAALEEALRQGVGPREWYYALLDYGSHLKRTLPNPSRRSAHHVRQSAFEGSHRQKRAALLRAVIAESGRTADDYADDLAASERAAGRTAPHAGEVLAILESLAAEGFLARVADGWFVA